MFKRVSEIVVRFPWVFIAFFLLTSVFFASFIPNATLEPDIKKAIPSNHPCRAGTDKIEDIFGGTQMIMAVIKADDVLNPATLKRTKEIAKRMRRLPQVDRVFSLFDLKDIRSEDGEMLVDPAVKTIPHTDAEREKLRQSLKDNDMVYGNVVAHDFTATAVIGMVRIGVSDNEIMSAVNKIIAEVPGPEPVELGGMPYVRTIVGHDMQNDLRFFMSFGLIIMLVFLFICFRQLRGVILPFLVVVMSIAVSMGLIPIMGWKIHVLTVLLPVMLIAIANDYGIHLIARYQEENYPGNTLTSKGLAKRIIQDLGKPVMFAAVTTMAGMLCLLSHVMIPAEQLGVLASVGIAYAFLASTTFIPAVIAILPKARPVVDLKKESGKRPALDLLLLFVSRFVSKRPKSIIVCTIITVAAVSTGIYFLKVETNLVNFYPSDAPVAVSANMVNKYFGGNTSISILAEGDIKDPAILRQIDDLERSLEAQSNVGTTTSLARVIRKMNKVMHDGDPRFDRIPDTREAIAQYLLLYSMSGDPDDFDKLVDFPYKHAQIMARINTTGMKGISKVVKFTEDYIKKHPNSPFTILGGHGVMFTRMVNIIVNGQILSLFASLLVVTILMTLLFRSAIAGLMAFLNLSLSMALLFGLMGYLGINLDVATSMLSAIMIGAGVDYTIHFLWRYREEKASGKDPRTAVIITLTTVGRGIIFNALSVVVGFGVLFASAFLPVKFFGFLVVVSISACLVGALVLLPAISLVFRPKFLEFRPTIKPTSTDHIVPFHKPAVKGHKTIPREDVSRPRPADVA